MFNQIAIVTTAIQKLCTYLQYRTRWYIKASYCCLNLTLVKTSCRKASMTINSLSICWLFYVFAFSGKDLFIWDAAHYEL